MVPISTTHFKRIRFTMLTLVSLQGLVASQWLLHANLCLMCNKYTSMCKSFQHEVLLHKTNRYCEVLLVRQMASTRLRRQLTASSMQDRRCLYFCYRGSKHLKTNIISKQLHNFHISSQNTMKLLKLLRILKFLWTLFTDIQKNMVHFSYKNHLLMLLNL